MHPLRDYFNKLADNLQSEFELAGQASHNPDIGDNREQIVIKFLNDHLPERLRAIQGGSIITKDGETSGQIDVIVKNDLFPKMEHNRKNYVLIESVAAAISVKSRLDSANLEDALNNLKTIPEFDADTMKLNQGAIVREGLFEKFRQHWPLTAVFAWDSVNPQILHETTVAFMNDNSIDAHRMVDFVLVNKSLVLQHMMSGGSTASGTIIQPNTVFQSRITDPNLVGVPLLKLLAGINNYIPWMNYMAINYDAYANAAFVEQLTH